MNPRIICQLRAWDAAKNGYWRSPAPSPSVILWVLIIHGGGRESATRQALDRLLLPFQHPPEAPAMFFEPYLHVPLNLAKGPAADNRWTPLESVEESNHPAQSQLDITIYGIICSGSSNNGQFSTLGSFRSFNVGRFEGFSVPWAALEAASGRPAEVAGLPRPAASL